MITNRTSAGELFDHLLSGVRGAIIHDEDFILLLRKALLEQAVEGLAQIGREVVCTDHRGDDRVAYKSRVRLRYRVWIWVQQSVQPVFHLHGDLDREAGRRMSMLGKQQLPHYLVLHVRHAVIHGISPVAVVLKMPGNVHDGPPGSEQPNPQFPVFVAIALLDVVPAQLAQKRRTHHAGNNHAVFGKEKGQLRLRSVPVTIQTFEDPSPGADSTQPRIVLEKGDGRPVEAWFYEIITVEKGEELTGRGLKPSIPGGRESLVSLMDHG